MIIKSMTASFGKLENETLELNEGLNIISAPNESGKSTWSAFICAMLYGIDSAERAKAGSLPDKAKFLPWSGAPMEGRMELESGGRGITLTRSTKSKNAPMRELSATYTGTNEKVEKLTSQNVGELLTGVSKDVFRRSAFVGQRALSFGGSAELEKRINSIVSTGEEKGSYTEADARLREWQRRRRNSRGGGLLPELESSIASTEKALDDMSGLVSGKSETERQLEQVKGQRAQLEARRTELRRVLRAELTCAYKNGAAQLKACSDGYADAKVAHSQCKSDLEKEAFYGKEPQKLKNEADADAEQARQLQKHAKAKCSALLSIVLLVLAVVSASIYTSKHIIPLIVCAALSCAAGMALLFRYLRQRRQRTQAREQYAKLLAKYRVQSPEAIIEAVEEYSRLYSLERQAAKAEQDALSAYTAAADKQEKLNDSFTNNYNLTDARPNLVHLSAEYDSAWEEVQRLNLSCASAEKREKELAEQVQRIGGQLEATGDPLVLASDLGCMREERERLEAECEALTLAEETLREADSELKNRFSPRLGALAAEYMGEVTGGRYTEVLVNRDFSACTRTINDTVAHQSEYLSVGTVDLLYLCVRLAVCELALPEGETCPLIIDDALVNFDDERTAQAMKLLKKLSRKRQVVLFTCRDEKMIDPQTA